ncbi:hypothetical protein [Nocardia brasiliensis]|uniref:hypothetical protein n=1 Tax=Nocardia brasiliensis TaxID=37326 RepID=UPI00245839CA|nr:hypothetical protein [Nocardia brasiliensis]
MFELRSRRVVLGIALGALLVEVAAAPAQATRHVFSEVDTSPGQVGCILDDQEVFCVVHGWAITLPGPKPDCGGYGPYPKFTLRNQGPAEASYSCTQIVMLGERLPFRKIIASDAITCTGLPRESGIQCVNAEYGFNVSRTKYTLR